MTGDAIGQVLLLAACCLAVGSGVAPWIPIGGRSAAHHPDSSQHPESSHDPDRLHRFDPNAVATVLLAAAAACLWAAVAVLTSAILRLDTSYAYVAEQTRSGMSLPIRFSALWSGAEGSLLLFGAIAVTTTLVGHRSAPRWQRSGTAMVALGFALASFSGANPFERLDLPPLSGAGMAPILEHYAMVIHPPMLYIGMCLSLTPALLRDRASAHRWALASMAILTLSLGFGSAWAYVELGWGGWWAWDPIENVALIVWLFLAAGLHWQPLDRRQRRGSGLTSAIILWALCWPAVLGGAALTRTSLRTSVHAFSDAAGLAVWLWPIAIVATIGAMLRVWEDRPEKPGPLPTRLPQTLLLLTALVVAAGTYRPFVGGDGTAGWFYSRTLFPVAIVGAILIGVIPRWRSEGTGPLGGFPMQAALRFGTPGSVALAAAIAIAGWREWWQLVLAAAVGFGAALVIASGRSSAARLAGHLGILCILFAALSGTASTEEVVRLQPGEVVEVSGHSIELLSTDIIGEEPLQAQARILVDGAYELTPSVSVFPERNLRLPEVSTRTRPWLDSQAVLRDVDAETGALVTILFRPWNQLVWWGVALMALAALLILFKPRSSMDHGSGSAPKKSEPARTTNARAG